jgi:acetyl-CoA carboxylase biotin carboxyl carrier protein
VEPEDTVAVIEAMKLLNPVAAGVGGMVLAVLVRDGQSVEFGQELLRLKTDISKAPETTEYVSD